MTETFIKSDGNFYNRLSLLWLDLTEHLGEFMIEQGYIQDMNWWEELD